MAYASAGDWIADAVVSKQMNGTAKKRLGPRDWIFLLLLGLAIAVGTRLLLPLHSKPSPVAFDESVLSEGNPFVADIRALTQVVRQRYAYLEHRQELDGLDLAELEATALAALGPGDDEELFRRAARLYVAGLHDGHALAWFSEYRLPSSRHWPFTALLVAEGVMVDGVHPDAADVLQRGDLVLAVDGRGIDPCIAEVAREIPASTGAARRREALSWLTTWSKEAEIALKLMRPGQGQCEVTVPCPLRRLTIPAPGVLPSDREERMLAGGIAYFRPGDFAAPADSGFKDASPDERKEILAQDFAELDQTFAKLAGARALILDLRDDPGGTDLLGKALVSRLMEPGHPYLLLSSKVRGGWSKPSPTFYSAPRPENVFLGKLVCLIDAGTFSVADNVAACLRDLHPDVTFVGENTGAGTGAPRSFTLPRTAAQVRLCTMRVWSPHGRMIEGVGTAPDVKIVRTRDDVLAGRDTTMEAALKLLEE